MKEYQMLLAAIMKHGKLTSDRTGTGTRSMFGGGYRVNLKEGFPLLTSRKISFRVAALDLLWMLSGSTNVNDLKKDNVNIWNEWATKDGSLGPIYGALWRNFPNCKKGSGVSLEHETIDQIDRLINKIRQFPDSRDLIVSAYNPATTPNPNLSPQQNVLAGYQCLASCNTLLQFKVYGNEISLQLYQRSCDSILGLPTNLAQYALLLHMVAQQCNLEVGEFIHTFGDIHIYNNHQDVIDKLLSRKPYPSPRLVIKRKPESIFDYTIDDFEIMGYNYHPAIKATVSV